MENVRRTAWAALIWVSALGLAQAQGDPFAAAREELRQAGRNSGYAAFLTTLTVLGGDNELAGGNLTTGEGSGDDITISPTTVLIPWHIDFEEAEWVRLRFEFVAGYVSSSFDLRNDTGDSNAFHVDVTNRVAAADVGVGPSFELPWRISIQPLLHGALAYLYNRGDFGGPRGGDVRAVTKSVLFDLDGYYAGFGGSLAIRQTTRLGPVEVGPSVRYDVRRTFVIAIDDDADDGPLTSHWFTTHLDLRGPIYRWAKQDFTLGWMASFGYRLFLGDLRRSLPFKDYFVLTGGLWLRIPERTPLLSTFFNTVRVSGSWFLGEDLSGWSISGMVEF